MYASSSKMIYQFFVTVAPSPDWFVGVSGLNLCLKNCTWVTSKILPLYPWDAGTDNGVTYLVSRQPYILLAQVSTCPKCFQYANVD